METKYKCVIFFFKSDAVLIDVYKAFMENLIFAL